MTSIATFTDRQYELFGRIARTVENLKRLGKDKINRHSIDTRLHLLEGNWEKFLATHETLSTLRAEDRQREIAYFTDDLYTQCEDAFCSARTELLLLKDEFPAAEPSMLNASSASAVPHSTRALPRITLPKFSGEYHEWRTFHDLFSSMVIENSSISAVERLHYLKTHVTGEAAGVIANVAVTAENFEFAWDALVARYENKRVLLAAYFDRFTDLTKLASKSADALKTLLATTREVTGGLEALKISALDIWDMFLVYFVARRLDPDTLEAWELHLGSATQPALFPELASFLEGRIRALELCGPSSSSSSKSGAAKSSATKSKAPARANAATTKTSRCSCCRAAHYIGSCPDFAKKSLEDRRELVKTKRLCYNCLGEHLAAECRTVKCCRTCGERHHTLIHPVSASSSAVAMQPPSHVGQLGTTNASHPSASQSAAPAAGSALSLSATLAPEVHRPTTLLATARVRIAADSGELVEARALLDQGSELTFVAESLAQALRLPRKHAVIPVRGIGSHSAGSTRGMISLVVHSRSNIAAKHVVNAYVLPRLTGRIPATRVRADSWPHLGGLELADPTFSTPGRIDLVLGADVYGSLLRDAVRRGPSDSPVAQLTSLGWIISGPALEPSQRRAAPPARRSFTATPDHDLAEILSRFWKQEEVLPSSVPWLTPEEEDCEQHFAATHSRTPSGQYVVRLPFRTSPESLGNSRAAALKMHSTMQRRFDSDSSLADLYSEFMLEYETLGHMQRTAVTNSDAVSFFLPHHGVIRAGLTPRKIRVVFNGSMRTTSGVSLNDCLHVGPKLQPDLADVILRWRRHQFVFLADIEKMYRQVLVHPLDRRYQKILWSRQGLPDEYELCTVTYGLACAPFLAQRVIRQVAQDEGARFPAMIDAVKEEMYVDDVLSGGDTVQLAQEKARALNQLLMAGGFPLHKWVANYDAVLADIPTSQHGETLPRELGDDAVARALGLTWHPRQDTFVFRLRPALTGCPVTKRVVLSHIARIFDPLGWIAPVIITAKIFMQGLWKETLGWDDPLPPRLASTFDNFNASLASVPSLSIPRWIGVNGAVLGVEIHGFSDASQDALAAVVYVRVIAEFDEVRVNLLAAKSKVAPLAKQTIPRLELSAAVLLVRLVRRVSAVLHYDSAPVHLWVDSTVALTWLRGSPSQWKEYVANRVALAHELLPRAHWHHVAGVENPADCASRGLSPQLLADHGTWWRGPDWLSGPSTTWPSTAPRLDADTDLEVRPRRTHLAATARTLPWDLVARYSSLRRLIRVTAWIQRAADRFRRRPPSHHDLDPADLARAEQLWIRLEQHAVFAAEIAALSRGDSLPRSHPLLRLSPFVDGDGVLRVGGRLRNALLDPDAKHPVLLPRESHLTRLILDDVHRRTLHGGVQSMLATLRQRHWILGGRAPVASFVRRCVRCARYRAATASQLMGQLPPTRVTPARPFLTSGVDYAGPFSMKTWRGRAARTYKGFLVVFVCFATSAVHLELATDYSAQGFLAAYRRFVSRRGLCSRLVSDRGTNFVGADAELRQLFDAASAEFAVLSRALASDGTQWVFNPAGAPHFGGKWEAAVKSVKHHLRRVVGDTPLTYEEFTTLLAQVEAVLNSRPLCPLSDDPADVEALTPAHFLIGGPLSSVPEPSLTDVPVSRLSRWQHLRQMLEHLWRRWSTEYLQRLQAIAKWRVPSDSIHIGTLVLLTDERYPPSKWPLARVIDVHPGQDGLIRVATVKTCDTTLKRPVVKLCPLPIDSVGVNEPKTDS